MIEIVSIISNGIVVVAIGALYAKINSHGKELNNHIVYTVEEITKRPDFDQVDKKICTKLKPMREDLTKVEEKLFDHLLEAK
ncbi:hypothetical protein KAX02_13780 [candidate division WOR-3 bacterium]|nr:hypothetical protein [candidate division WOR-3 bacterium]